MSRDLTKGSIPQALLSLAVPIMGTSLVQMSYNLINMIWIGKLGSGAVAAIGTAGFFMWLSLSVIRLVQTGTEVKIAQSIGAGKLDEAGRYASTAICLSVVFGVLYGVILLLTGKGLIAFFNLGDNKVVSMAEEYLRVSAYGIFLTFLNPVMSCIYNGSGNSKVPFKYNSIGLVLNAVIDPILIFVLRWGVVGAAIGSILAQVIVSLLLIRALYKRRIPFAGFAEARSFHGAHAKKILRIGAPVAFQSALFVMFSIILARLVAGYGAPAIAAQKVGVQVEAISYMTATGFSVALSAFTGQNFGAGDYDRLRRGMLMAAGLISAFGIATTALLYYGAAPIFRIFLDEPETLAIGVSYLKILALSQLFMCVEITMAGFFNGLGRTLPPAIMSILLTGMRIPLAYIIAVPSILGLDGIWWSISISSIAKGVVLSVMVVYMVKKIKKTMLFMTESV